MKNYTVPPKSVLWGQRKKPIDPLKGTSKIITSLQDKSYRKSNRRRNFVNSAYVKEKI